MSPVLSSVPPAATLRLSKLTIKSPLLVSNPSSPSPTSRSLTMRLAPALLMTVASSLTSRLSLWAVRRPLLIRVPSPWT